MTVISEQLSDVAGQPETRPVTFFVPTIRENGSGSGTVGSIRVDVHPVDGLLTTPDLDPGEVDVLWRSVRYRINVPASAEPVRLWPLIETSVPYDPPIVARVKQYRDEAEAARDSALEIVATPANSVEDITVSGDSLVFDMTRGPDFSRVVPSLTAAEAAKVAAQGSAAAAAGSATSASGSASTATTRAGEASASATAASSSATAAAGSASTATTKASEASGSANAAAGSATTATTKAGEAATSATSASGSATTATSKAGEASTSAATATTKAADAETARAAAVVARTGAETARDQAAQGAVPDGGVSTVKLVDGAVTKPKLSTGLQASIDKADSAVQGDDARLTDARTPTNHSTDKLTSGTLPVARGGTGRNDMVDGSYMRGAGSDAIQMRTPAQVLADIGAGTSNLTLGATGTTAMRGDAQQYGSALPASGPFVGAVFNVTE